MEKQHLRDLLHNLHAELERTDSVDQESREMLRDVMKEIHGLLEREDEQESAHEFREQLEDSARRFEVQHPTITAAIVQLIDALPK